MAPLLSAVAAEQGKSRTFCGTPQEGFRHFSHTPLPMAQGTLGSVCYQDADDLCPEVVVHALSSQQHSCFPLALFPALPDP